ncbi:LacI family DNA-binding transcriptional regulator [Spirochaeta lutea]|uniref:HTH lacI-type domain-containing protein n=1 Tax=Spirochaeta lutea TaxID=1480694 RepID=A0A098QT18_9SPIO|nr:LacI family DNA-binding transcriptional regulator [Spirochaeta lutea]KGE70814.1 hypothetical protein DC28_15120 [Spirochaeta lutea]
MRNKISLQDIATALDISKVTVSRALKGQPGVSESLRETIQSTAHEMGYEVQSLRDTKHQEHYAFITPTRFFLKTEHFYTDIYYYLHRFCDEKRHIMSLHIINPEMEKQGVLPSQMMEPGLTGIFVGGELSGTYLERLAELQIPVVVVDYFSPQQAFSHITVDNYYLGYKAASYLLHQGHTEIGFVGRPQISSNVTDRIMGVQKALGEHGLQLPQEWNIDNYDLNTGMYSLNLPLPGTLPTAFICHCDRAAYFLIEALRNQNITVPQEISIISFDDTETAQETSPPLTSIKIDRREFAAKAIEQMDLLLTAPQKAALRVYLETQLVERGSVRSLV